MERKRPTVAIVIPAYNEERRLPATLQTLRAFADTENRIAEIIVADDGSRDGTAAVVREVARSDSRVRLVSYCPNAGKGYAVRRGVLEATADQILLSDADLSTPIEEMGKLWRALERADVAIGSRALDPSLVKVRQGRLRRRMGQTFNALMRWITGLPYQDTQCGFKLLPHRIAREVFAEAVVDRFAWDVEMLMLIHLRRYSVAEVPVLWFNSRDSRVNILRDSLRMLIDTLSIRARLGKVSVTKSHQHETADSPS
jgi:dolichyl-phosphate beta-glucosyltransferase